ncbi:MAG TPA: L,D-transpeptidase family protein [Dissulfurispiraceae bacterium]
MVGGLVEYHVVKGDTIEGIGSKLGVKWGRIVRENGIDIHKPLRIGQRIRANTRKIVPKTVDNGIVINIPDKTLYFFKKGALVMSFPVGLGIASGHESETWRTPEGAFRVKNKQRNPKWYVPKSIRNEMAAKGHYVEPVVQPGPDNPLGKHVIRTTLSGIEIHETIWPSSVYQFRSHGCIRVLPEDMGKLFKEVEKDTPGEIIYVPVKVAASDNGRVFLEVHRDVYGKTGDLNAEARRLVAKAGLSKRVDWQKADKVVREKSGIAEDITFSLLRASR